MLFFLIIRRILVMIPVLLAVILIAFSLIRVAPGGPFDAERQPPPEVMKALSEKYNLDASFSEQFFDYISGIVLHGDLGPSYHHPGYTVQEIIANALPVSIDLGIRSLLIALFFGIALGSVAALKSNRWQDYSLMAVAMIGICMPTFLIAPLLVLAFSLNFEIFPVSGWGDRPFDKFLPSLSLGVAYTAYIARLTRGGLLEVLNEDYVRTARAKGLSNFRIMVRHVLPNGIQPVIVFLGPALAGILAGSFVIETVFQIPGIGRFFVESTFNRDYTMILGLTVLYSTMIISANTLSDILLLVLNPKLRDGGM